MLTLRKSGYVFTNSFNSRSSLIWLKNDTSQFWVNIPLKIYPDFFPFLSVFFPTETLQFFNSFKRPLKDSTEWNYIYVSNIIYDFQVSNFDLIGSAKTMISNRISFFLGVNIPSVTIDSYGVGSATASEEAFELIKSGAVDSAIVCARNTVLRPEISLQLFHSGKSVTLKWGVFVPS